MTAGVAVAVILSVIGLAIFAMRTPSRWERLISQAGVDGSVEDLLSELAARPELFRPRFYDEAMQQLLPINLAAAVELTVQFVPQAPEHKLCQKWLRELQAGTEQPLLETDFLAEYLREGCSPGEV